MEALARMAVASLGVLTLFVPLHLQSQLGTVAISPKIRIVDGTAYSHSSQGIQSAIQDIGLSPGTVYLTPGVYDISSEIKITQPGIRIRGDGVASTLLNVTNQTANVFNVMASWFELTDLGIKSTTQKTSGSLFVMGGPEGRVHNVRIDGNFWNGFTAVSGEGGSWTLDTIRVIGPATWNYLLSLRSPAHTIASTHIHDLYVSNAIRWKTAAIVLDTGVDTFICSDAELGPVLVENSLKGQAPRWIRFTNSFIEAGYAGKTGGIGLEVEAARDLRYQGYFASSQYGVVVGAGARGVQVSESEFVNIGRSAVTVAGGADDVSIVHNTFEDTGVEADGQFDTVAAAENIAALDVSYNTFKSAQSNRPRYNLTLPARCTACVADGNRYGGFVMGAISGGK
jgi:hypothetical protein